MNNTGIPQQPTGDRFLNPQQPLRPAFTPSKFKARSRRGNVWPNQEIELSAPNHWDPGAVQIPGQWAPRNQVPGGQWNHGN
ncbi:hypothetical protein C0J52_10665 [Blattella germanica]|nr:hypothetical protein C0J52_10665 [Blattella germanica]